MRIEKQKPKIDTSITYDDVLRRIQRVHHATYTKFRQGCQICVTIIGRSVACRSLVLPRLEYLVRGMLFSSYASLPFNASANYVQCSARKPPRAQVSPIKLQTPSRYAGAC